VTRLWAGRSGFDYRQRQVFLSLSPLPDRLWSPPDLHWVPGTLSPAVKRPGLKAGHLLKPSTEVRNPWSYTPTPPYVFMALCLIKYRDKFTKFVFPLLQIIQSTPHCSRQQVSSALLSSTSLSPYFSITLSPRCHRHQLSRSVFKSHPHFPSPCEFPFFSTFRNLFPCILTTC